MAFWLTHTNRQLFTGYTILDQLACWAKIASLSPP